MYVHIDYDSGVSGRFRTALVPPDIVLHILAASGQDVLVAPQRDKENIPVR